MAPSKMHPLRIAAADDDPEMRDFYARVLPRLGHEVVALARTGRELVEQCAACRPGLLIVDIKMPEMDGLAAAAEICRHQPLPIILVSALHSPELLRQIEDKPVLGYLVKPVKPADLETAITIAVKRFAELQSLRQQQAELRRTLEDRKLIERAKGLLMQRTGLSEAEAYRSMQRTASRTNQKLVAVARSILTAEEAASATGSRRSAGHTRDDHMPDDPADDDPPEGRSR